MKGELLWSKLKTMVEPSKPEVMGDVPCLAVWICIWIYVYEYVYPHWFKLCIWPKSKKSLGMRCEDVWFWGSKPQAYLIASSTTGMAFFLLTIMLPAASGMPAVDGGRTGIWRLCVAVHSGNSDAATSPQHIARCLEKEGDKTLQAGVLVGSC